jgi:phenylacetate-CoA ligase
LRQLYLSAFHVAPRTVADYAAVLAERQVTHLFGYSAAVAALAALAVDAGVTLPRLRVVITIAEPLYAAQRAVIERAFGCPVRETYGVGELVIAASECERGELHLWPEAGTVEVVRGEHDEAAPAGEVGDLLATGLVNTDMPLIRYRVGDRAAVAPGGEPCACGRRLPRLASVEGRLEDQVVTLDGRWVGRFDAVFRGDLQVREAQVVQVGVADVVVRVVPAAGFDAATGRVLARRMRDRLGDMRVSIDLVDTIERGAAGKFRAVVSAIDRRERSELGHRRGQSPVEEAAGPPEDEAIGDRRDDEEVEPRGG